LFVPVALVAALRFRFFFPSSSSVFVLALLAQQEREHPVLPSRTHDRAGAMAKSALRSRCIFFPSVAFFPPGGPLLPALFTVQQQQQPNRLPETLDPLTTTLLV
jgi:hypothetical protein